MTLSLCREVEFDNAFSSNTRRARTPGGRVADPSGGTHRSPPRAVAGTRERYRQTEIRSLCHATGADRWKAEPEEQARMMGRTPCNKLVLFDGSERHRESAAEIVGPAR